MKWTFYYYCSKTVDNILGFPVLTLHFWLFNNLKLYMCIPLRIDQGLGWVFDTLMALELYQLLWQAPSLFTFPMAPFGRGVPLGIPEIEQIQELFLLGWALEKVMQGEKAVWAFSFAHWSRDQLWAGAITQGDLLSLSRAVPWLEGSRLLQHRLPRLQETGLVFVILLALLPFEQQPTFFKTWSEARPLAFPPGKSLGLMGWSCWVPPLLARLWQHGTLLWDTVGTTWALGVFAWATPCPHPVVQISWLTG